MAELNLPKTVTFGGFDKKDVLILVDSLNQNIQELQNENEYLKKKLSEADEALAATDREIEELKRKMREQNYNS